MRLPPHRELHRRSQWLSPLAPHTPITAVRGPIESSTEGPRDAARMPLPHRVQCFVAPLGAPPKIQVSQPACVSPTQYSVP
eukprot:4812536-Pyramimonas_sp.AAC.1